MEGGNDGGLDEETISPRRKDGGIPGLTVQGQFFHSIFPTGGLFDSQLAVVTLQAGRKMGSIGHLD